MHSPDKKPYIGYISRKSKYKNGKLSSYEEKAIGVFNPQAKILILLIVLALVAVQFPDHFASAAESAGKWISIGKDWLLRGSL